MIVVTIVAILALVAIPLYSQQTIGAAMSEGVAGCGTIQTALRAYYSQNGNYTGVTLATLQNAGYLGPNDLDGNNFNAGSYAVTGTATGYQIVATCNGPNATGAAQGLTYIITNTAGVIATGGTWNGATQVQ
jgi:Tfp pilus assembly protein PilE